MVTLGEVLRWILITAGRGYRRLAAYLLRRDTLLVGSERRFRALLETAPDAIVIVDDHGHVSLVNGAAERMFGYRRKEIVGQSVTDLIPTRYRNAHRVHQHRFVRSPAPRPMGGGLELYGRRADGSEFPVEISLGPLETPDGLLVTAAVRDVTERKRIEAELTRRAEALERSNADLEQFAYVASHDLQAPLRSVAGFVELLRRRYTGRIDADADEYIRRAVAGVQRMQQLVDDLLAYSRVSNLDGPLQPVDCGATVDEVLRMLAHEIEVRGAEVTVGELPRVMGSSALIGQVFQNLIANAVKFTREGRPEVEVSATRDAGAWRFSVRDNGIGIEPEHSERVFKMFQRLHGPDEFPGTGIGLAICKRIVEYHGGTIRAEPAPSGGTVVSFTLPDDDEPP